jgi:hypothetical protein
MIRRAVVALLVGAVLSAVAPVCADASVDHKIGDGRPETPITAVEARGITPPRVVKGTDDQLHVEYDLAITNTFTSDVTLVSLDVLDERGVSLLSLEGDALGAVTTRFLDVTPALTVPPSGTVEAVVDVVLSSGARVPARLSHRLVYDFPPDALFHQLIGSRQVNGPVLRVERQQPIVVSPPLRGSGWIAVNACCEPSSHRSFVLAANGGLVTPEVFAIDWIQARDGLLAEGDGSRNDQYFGHGEPVLAAASGEVVRVANNRPEVPPGTGTTDNPTLETTTDFAGNFVLIRIQRGVYALYAHMITGSVQVQVGDHVETGQQLGLLGNSGNTSGPHLHFGLIDGLGLLSSDSLPFVIDRFTFEGQAEVSTTTGAVTITGTPRRVRNAHPLTNSVGSFTTPG